MGLYDNVKKAAKSKGYSINRLEKELGFARSYISKFKSITPSAENIQKIADFLEVSSNYLLTGKEDSSAQKITSISEQEELDIINDVDVIIEKLKNGEEVVLRFNGEKTDDEGIELLRESLLNTCRTAKLLSKQKE